MLATRARMSSNDAAAGGGGSVTVTAAGSGYNDKSSNAGDDEVIATVNVGTDNGSSKLWIVVAIRQYSGSEFTASESPTVEVDGVAAATVYDNSEDFGDNSVLAYVAQMDHPGGSTAEIWAYWTTSIGRCRLSCQLYVVDGGATTASDTDNSFSSSANSFPLSLTPSSGGAVLVGGYHDNTAGAALSVVTTDYAGTNNGDSQYFGSDDDLAASAITPTFSCTSASFGGFVGVAIAPA